MEGIDGRVCVCVERGGQKEGVHGRRGIGERGVWREEDRRKGVCGGRGIDGRVCVESE